MSSSFTRHCDWCGTEYAAEKITSRYHTQKCRDAARTARKTAERRRLAEEHRAELVRQALEVKPPGELVSPDDIGQPADLPASVYRTTWTALETVAKIHDPLAQVALALALRLDDAEGSDSGKAALARELRVMLEQLLGSSAAAPVKDEIEEMRQRREARRSGVHH